MKLSPEQKRQLEEDIKTMVDDISDEIGYCSCYEGDLHGVYSHAKQETARRIVKLLETWNLI